MKNIEIVINLYELFAKKDQQAIRAIFEENIEWTQMKGFPNGGHYVGADAIFKNVFAGFRDNWEDWKAVVTEYIDAGDSVFAMGYYEGIFKQTGSYVKAEFTHRYVLENQKIKKFTQFTDTFLLAKAMGKAIG